MSEDSKIQPDKFRDLPSELEAEETEVTFEETFRKVAALPRPTAA